MNLPVRSFRELVQAMCTAVTASASGLVDSSVGSVLRAVIEANAGVGLWIQWLITLTLRATRAATCTGADLDSWMADFSFFRRPAIAATGTVTFRRNAAINPVLVPPGTVVKTMDGSVSFRVTAASDVSTWQADPPGFLIPAGVASVDVPVTAVASGGNGNVLPRAISLLASPLAGVDGVSNAVAMTGGADAEPDDAFRSRFTLYLASLSKATGDAIAYAVSQVSGTLKYRILENQDPSETFRVGHVLVVLDDGTGQPSGELMSAASAAIETVRGIGITIAVVPAAPVIVNVSLSLTTLAGVGLASVQPLVTAAIQTYVQGIAIGGSLSITRISQVAYESTGGIRNIADVTINGGPADLLLGRMEVAYCEQVQYA